MPNCTGSAARFSMAMGAEEVRIEASFCEAIRIAREQKSISLEKRAEGTYEEYRRQKASGAGGGWIPATALLAHCSSVHSLAAPLAKWVSRYHPKWSSQS